MTTTKPESKKTLLAIAKTAYELGQWSCLRKTVDDLNYFYSSEATEKLPLVDDRCAREYAAVVNDRIELWNATVELNARG